MCKQTSINITIAVDLAVGILILVTCKIKNKIVFQSFSEKARAIFYPSLKMLQIHASSKTLEHIGDTASANIQCDRFVLILNPKTFYPPILVFHLVPRSPGLLQRLPSLPGRRRTVVLTHRLPCVTPWQSRICPLVTRETSVRHSHCSSETGDLLNLLCGSAVDQCRNIKTRDL